MADLGDGEAPYMVSSLPGPGETHPVTLGLTFGDGRVIPTALEALAPRADLQIPAGVAEQFRIARHQVEAADPEGRDETERVGRVLSKWGFCVLCGHLLCDGRVESGRYARPGWRGDDWTVLEACVGGIAHRCLQCRHRGHRPALRVCLAPGCERRFSPNRADHETCSNACRKALGELRREHSRYERALTLEKAVERAASERQLGTYVRLRKQLAEDGLENLAAPRCAYAAVPRCRCRECETLRRADRNWS